MAALYAVFRCLYYGISIQAGDGTRFRCAPAAFVRSSRTVVDDLTCPVPWCQTSICGEAARYVIASRDELPAGCANCHPFTPLSDHLRRALMSGDTLVTAGARGVLSLRPRGAIAQSILAQLEEGRLVFLEPRTPRPLRSTGLARRAPLTPPDFPDPRSETEDKVAWIRFRVVDDQSGEPLAGVALKVTQPNGRTFDYATRADGMVEVNGIDPGLCDVASSLDGALLSDTYAFVLMGDQPSPPPLSAPSGNGDTMPLDPSAESRTRSAGAAGQGVRIALIEEHKVRTGESIKSLAEANGLTWQELARFNWSTAVPDEINVKLADEVGCTRKAPDGVNYRFDDGDEPGLVLIPRPWSVTGLATERMHTIRVRTEARFYLILENQDKLRIPEAEYEVTLSDGSTRMGRLGRGGVAVIKNATPGDLEVYYPDQDDIEAKSLAACARKAMDDRNLTEVFRVFKYPRWMIQRVSEAYERYYNDHTGGGLMGDVDHEATDPHDRRALHALLWIGALQEEGGAAESGDEPAREPEAI